MLLSEVYRLWKTYPAFGLSRSVQIICNVSSKATLTDTLRLLAIRAYAVHINGERLFPEVVRELKLVPGAPEVRMDIK